MSRRTFVFCGPGIEAAAPIFADSDDELHEAMRFMKTSPIKGKAFVRLPFFSLSMPLFYRVAMTHYPHDHIWGVDNMWTNARPSDLIPHLKRMSETLPPPPSHVLWLNWFPPKMRPDMAFSMESDVYLALYGSWKSASDSNRYENWATDHMK